MLSLVDSVAVYWAATELPREPGGARDRHRHGPTSEEDVIMEQIVPP